MVLEIDKNISDECLRIIFLKKYLKNFKNELKSTIDRKVGV